MKRIFIILIAAFNLETNLVAQNSSEGIGIAIDNLKNDSVLKHGQFAVSIRKMDNGKSIFESTDDKTLMPASNLKILTTAAALELLGENFKYATDFEYDGIVKNGILSGNFYIRGSGDPTLGAKRIQGNEGLDQIMLHVYDGIKKAGIHKIDGSIIADAKIYEVNSTPDFWTWGDIGNYFGAGTEGINVNENSFKIYYKPAKKIGEKAIILKTEPYIPNLEIVTNVTVAVAGTGDQTCIYGSPLSPIRYVSGTIPFSNESYSIKGSLPDPPYFFAYSLDKYLKSKGIQINGHPKKMGDSDSILSHRNKQAYTHLSPPLSTIILQTNTYSLNLYAESILKTIGSKVKNEGSTLASARALKEFWKSKGLDTLGLFIYDGSGLSRVNGITAAQLSYVLYLISKETYYPSFYNSLAVAGVSGTLAKLCKGSLAENNLRAKSGSFHKVVCYSGYVKSKSGDLLSFAIMTNNFEGTNSAMTKKIEKLMIAISEQ